MEENKKIKEDIKIKLDKPVPFNSVGDMAITTTTELAKIINDIFVQVFKDYYGCHLQVQFQPERGSYVIVPKLYFHILKKEQYTDDAIFAFNPLTSKPNDNIIGRVQRLSQISTTSGVKVELTEEGQSVLDDFIISTPMKNQKFDWNSAYTANTTDTETFISVFKLDILKFIKKIFGAKDENGSELYYQITPTYMIGGNSQYKKPDNWALSILRLNHANEANAAELLGMYTPSINPGPVVVTDTTK